MLAIGATFIAVAASVASAAFLLIAGRSPAQKRLIDATAVVRAEARTSGGPASLTERPSRTVERIVSFVPKSPSEMNRLRRRLARAGYHSLNAALVFSFAELIGP